jgi:hypothetical protein
LIRAVSLGYVYIIAKMGLNAKVIVLKIKKKLPNESFNC